MCSTTELSASPKSGSATLVIENMSQLSDEDHKNIEFTINGYIFGFTFCPKRKIRDCISKNEIVYICLSAHTFEPLTVHHKVSILGYENVKLFTNEYTWTFDGYRDPHIAKFINHDQMMNPRNNYLTNDTLTVLCEVELIGQGEKYLKPIQDSTALSDNLECLLTDGKLSDATLVVGRDEKEIHVHKTVLAARSPVFAAMFEHDCEEKRLGKVNITDMDVDVCQELIRYIYSGKVDKLDLYAMDLLEAADKYQLDSLKNICDHFLCSTLSSESVASVLMLADLHHVTNLKTKCIQFISQNAQQVETSDGWKELDPKLVRELFLYSAKKK